MRNGGGGGVGDVRSYHQLKTIPTIGNQCPNVKK